MKVGFNMLLWTTHVTDDDLSLLESIKKAGYDGVEVMGSEGYFLNQFLVTHTNKRTDRWGGSYENRMRLPLEVVKRVRAAVGEDFIVIYRLSMIDLVPNGSSWDEVVTLAKAVEAAGASIINTGIGCMAVQFKGQRGLAPHTGPEIPDDERIRAAGKIGDISTDKLGVLLHFFSGLQDHLAHAPVHVRFCFFIIKTQEIVRQDHDAP